jgi:hypothetical protein
MRQNRPQKYAADELILKPFSVSTAFILRLVFNHMFLGIPKAVLALLFGCSSGYPERFKLAGGCFLVFVFGLGCCLGFLGSSSTVQMNISNMVVV